MPKGTNQKMKLYRLAKIMQEETDEDHTLTMREIRDELAACDVTADRKTLYDDLESLQEMGLTVDGQQIGRDYYYRVIKKQFEIAELKLLVDAIQASKFITAKKSNELIKKLTGFASKYEAKQLNRQVVVNGRIKTMNESIYYVVDDIHRAIATNRQISFEYLKWNLNKELVPRKDDLYEISPWALMWDDENYYLVGYDAATDKIKHYRVDKMRKISVLENKKRLGKDHFKKFNMADYAKESFGMYGGEETMVTLQFQNDLVGVIIDRFGKDITIRKVDDEHSETRVSVVVSDMFFGWIFGVGTDLKIVGPEDVRKKYLSALTERQRVQKEMR